MGFTDSIGLTPFGSGTPASANAPPDTLGGGAPFINSRTRDFERASDGSLRRMPSTRHRMLVALTTIEGTNAAEPGFGIKLPKRIDGSFERKVRNAVTRAVRHIVADGSARIDFVRTTTTQYGRARIHVSYTDLVTDESDEIIL
jgi:phage baseplate assembly protein W